MAGLDFNFNEELVVLGGFEGFGISHDSAILTVTAKMTQGSLLKYAADGVTLVEATAADAADVVAVIDDITFRRQRSTLITGDIINTAVAVRGCILNAEAIHYNSNVAVDPAALVLLKGQLNKFATVADAANVFPQ